MAPRTRSNRAEKLALQTLLSSGIPVNTHGFPALPNELFSKILSYLPAFPIPHDVWVYDEPDPYRQLTLYYLSQTCRSLRMFFLRYAWERIEVFGGMQTPVGKLATNVNEQSDKRGINLKDPNHKTLVEEILRQLETVTVRNPDLRQYVSVVDLTILKYSHKSVVPEIAQSLSFLPNLHTLQFIFQFQPAYPRKIFANFQYPNVHTLNISDLSPYEDILHACPNTKHFSFYKDLGMSFHVQHLLDNKCAGKIEKLGVLTGIHYHLPDFVERLPSLRDLSLDCHNLRISGEALNYLSSLPLHTIRLRLDYWIRPFLRHVPATPDERQRWIDLVKGILVKCPQQEVAKKVIVVNFDKTVEVFSV